MIHENNFLINKCSCYPFTIQVNLQHALFVDETISPTSIGAYFENNGYECTVCKHTERTRKMMASHPVINSEQTQGDTDSCDYNELYEWLGAVACDIDW